ncbi:DUF262 domain-containing protein [Flavobacterium plurextorum]|uniref:DUF262 domain-containing protein n=1 Tax=Flavobacterium TaxID=237 RepID=UPI00214DAAEE|nr:MULTISPECIES: DUF262 domain-containing protein [Flavobacterium]UUW08380.1 DUF262 domain-containing protein [Flavobacterium plurextorum]
MINLTEKPIAELLGMNFLIPSYQRGYRWTKQQVQDLLDDINSFTPLPISNSNNKTWYCLQPIVVKECDEETKKRNNLSGVWYEVIDGQQRLTTIFLIIHYANEMWVGKQKISEFNLKYETRDKSFEFLKNQKIDDLKNSAVINNSNIDFHHISNAYDTIHKWVLNYKNKFKVEFDNNNFQSKFKSDSKVIWYEVASDKDSIEIFTRINMGKIPLTNAELIKALFLNSSNFKDSNSETIRLKQLEIASEWDRIEYALQNDELWYFINNSENELPTRIDYIFQLMESIEGAQNTKDKNSTFRFFAEKFKTKSKDEIDANWKEIKRIFQTIEEWFYDRELYHKIGYLIATNTNIKDLLKDVKNKKKDEFKIFVDSEIHKKVNIDLANLEYKNGSVRNILLLHNIQTMLNFKKETSRFPFNRFKDKKIGWDIEHIHAIATEVKVKKEEQINWLKLNYIATDADDDVNKKIKDILQNEAPVEEFDEIINYVLGEEDNNIRNLCLLDSGTNRSYKNDSFKEKRRKIIENEKNGVFIPICTKNVFMKYYSKELKDLEVWNETDRGSYFTDIDTIIFPHKKQS